MLQPLPNRLQRNPPRRHKKLLQLLQNKWEFPQNRQQPPLWTLVQHLSKPQRLHLLNPYPKQWQRLHQKQFLSLSRLSPKQRLRLLNPPPQCLAAQNLAENSGDS